MTTVLDLREGEKAGRGDLRAGRGLDQSLKNSKEDQQGRT